MAQERIAGVEGRWISIVEGDLPTNASGRFRLKAGATKFPPKPWIGGQPADAGAMTEETGAAG